MSLVNRIRKSRLSTVSITNPEHNLCTQNDEALCIKTRCFLAIRSSIVAVEWYTY
jgi:hypothetical protein